MGGVFAPPAARAALTTDGDHPASHYNQPPENPSSPSGHEGGAPMAEPPATTPSAATAASDELLATKLHIPRTRPGFVARPRLVDRLVQAGGELTLVCAPAGFGKTALLADWAHSSQRPVAWLSLDDADNDPARFWRHVAAALDGVRPGVAQQVAVLLQGLQPSSFQAVVTTLVNELAGVAEEAVLVLDDYHLIRAPQVHQSLEFLLAHLPACLRLVVASRADPPLPLARLRARGQLAELREGDMRFSPQEAAALLCSAVGAELPEAAVAALAERTEGWVAGLQLAALSLQGHGDPVGFVAGFSGSHRYVLDYLAEEVLDRQPAEVRSFLLETSVLERLSGPLCEAVTGRADSQQLLEQAERANLFLLPLDEQRGWWRYHQLFADLLRVRLQQHQPERVPELHRAAAAWCEAQRLVDDAIRHALAAGDAVWAARLIEQHFDAMLWRSEDPTLRRWLQALPAALVGSRPRLCLIQAIAAIAVGQLEAGQSLLADAEGALAGGGDEPLEPYEPSVGRATSLVANLPAAIALQHAAVAHLRGDAERTVTFARQAAAELDVGDWMLDSVTRWYLAVAEWLHGRLGEAERAFVAGISGWRTAGHQTLAAWGYHYLGQVQRAQGRLSAAFETYRQALEAAGEPSGPGLQLTGIASVGMAEVAYQRNELDSALRYATEGIALCRQFAYAQPLATGLATLAWIRQARGDQAGAVEAMRQAEQVKLSPAVVGLLNPVPALAARLALAHGDIAGAAHRVQVRGLDAEDEPSFPRERDYLVLARVLLAQPAPKQALGLLERLHAQAEAQGRTGSIIEIQALQALARSASGDQAGAQAALAEALTLGAPEGYLRLFLDEGPPMAALLRQLLAGRRPERPTAVDAIPREYLARLVNAFEQAGLPIRPPARRGGVVVAGLVEPLTARELEVLGLLAAGAPNRTIAEQLVVTPETVKKHLSHVFDKLGAANRTQVVARARELELLP
jgi:LuxR family transcriptional regulator, maltose regulon positive regulatory protein